MHYLQQHGIHVYLTDAIARMNEERPANATQYLHDYLDAVASGSNVLHRDFSYIQATPRNRLAFAAQLGKLLASSPEEAVKAADCFHLVELLGNGFPFEVVKRAAEVTEYVMGLREPRPASEPGVPLPKTSLVLFFRICFYYMEFMAVSEPCLVAAFEEHYKTEADRPVASHYSLNELQSIKHRYLALLNSDIAKLPVG
ncbi:hypothetical protein BC830DRAFT_1158418 [Chytriomyces sp. MP71]|nr:hypothetical protein BC830DRAFT_1158418 [Chytriomyces sp. MP71]